MAASIQLLRALHTASLDDLTEAAMISGGRCKVENAETVDAVVGAGCGAHGRRLRDRSRPKSSRTEGAVGGAERLSAKLQGRPDGLHAHLSQRSDPYSSRGGVTTPAQAGRAGRTIRRLRALRSAQERRTICRSEGGRRDLCVEQV